MDETLFAIDQAGTINDVLNILGAVAVDAGAIQRSYHFTPIFRGQTSPTTIVVAAGFDPAWIAQYERHRFRTHDPIPDAIMRAAKPLTWSQALEQAPMTDEVRKFVGSMQAHGLVHGFGVPLFGPNARNAYASFGFDKADYGLEEVRKNRLWAIAQAAHLRLCCIVNETYGSSDKALSPRERDVLEFVARGKSSSEIGEILGISSETVDTYLKRTFLKLGASSRVGAAIRALRLGLIQI
jgi:LuxR family transcriptional regulator, quorum-sensing system regulator BjaR1